MTESPRYATWQEAMEKQWRHSFTSFVHGPTADTEHLRTIFPLEIERIAGKGYDNTGINNIVNPIRTKQATDFQVEISLHRT